MPHCSCKMCQNSVSILLVTAIVFVNKCTSEVADSNDNRVYTSGLIYSADKDPTIIDGVTSGTFLAFEHCQKVFHWDRWNCPREEFDRQSRQHASKEAGFTQAIIAAGIVHSITKNCSRGEIADCSCDPQREPTVLQPKTYTDILFPSNNTTPSNFPLKSNYSDKTIRWSWGGCSDDTTYGSRIVRELLEGPEKNTTVFSFIAKHNYRLGREIIRQTMVKKCRCHGLSGSCSLQTCWMQQASFQIIAKKLKQKYKKAKRVTTETIEASISLSNSIKREDKTIRFPAPENMLMYLEQSSDYCVPNATQNWPGTKGRSCSRSKSELATRTEKRSCSNLCRQCGYKVRRERRLVKKRCNCSFQWCCEVKCDVCTEFVEEYFCY